MRLLKGGWAAKRFQGPALPWAGLLLVLLAASAVAVELLVKGLPANHSLYGDAKARWTINEYADLECPFCKVYTPRLKRWVDSHPDVNLVWRHLPLQMHGEAARHQARLVECAGIQGGAKAFWSAIDAIFAQSVGNGASWLAAHWTFLNWTSLDWRNVRKTTDLLTQISSWTSTLHGRRALQRPRP